MRGGELPKPERSKRALRLSLSPNPCRSLLGFPRTFFCSASGTPLKRHPSFAFRARPPGFEASPEAAAAAPSLPPELLGPAPAEPSGEAPGAWVEAPGREPLGPEMTWDRDMKTRGEEIKEVIVISGDGHVSWELGGVLLHFARISHTERYAQVQFRGEGNHRTERHEASTSELHLPRAARMAGTCHGGMSADLRRYVHLQGTEKTNAMRSLSREARAGCAAAGPHRLLFELEPRLATELLQLGGVHAGEGEGHGGVEGGGGGAVGAGLGRSSSDRSGDGVIAPAGVVRRGLLEAGDGFGPLLRGGGCACGGVGGRGVCGAGLGAQEGLPPADVVRGDGARGGRGGGTGGAAARPGGGRLISSSEQGSLLGLFPPLLAPLRGLCKEARHPLQTCLELLSFARVRRSQGPMERDEPRRGEATSLWRQPAVLSLALRWRSCASNIRSGSAWRSGQLPVETGGLQKETTVPGRNTNGPAHQHARPVTSQ